MRRHIDLVWEARWLSLRVLDRMRRLLGIRQGMVAFLQRHLRVRILTAEQLKHVQILSREDVLLNLLKPNPYTGRHQPPYRDAFLVVAAAKNFGIPESVAYRTLKAMAAARLITGRVSSDGQMNFQQYAVGHWVDPPRSSRTN